MSILEVEINKEVWRLISGHLPHAGNSDMEYDAALLMMSDALPKDRSKVRTCIGVDANAEVGGCLEHDDQKIIGRHGMGQRNSRGCL